VPASQISAFEFSDIVSFSGVVPHSARLLQQRPGGLPFGNSVVQRGAAKLQRLPPAHESAGKSFIAVL